MGNLSAETELKIKNIMDEIDSSNLDYDDKTFQQEKILQARACANGSKDKIDDISKVLLQSAIHEVKTEIRLPAKISMVVREELKETEKNITEAFRKEIKDHAESCWKKMYEMGVAGGRKEKKPCHDCNHPERSTGNGKLQEADEEEEKQPKTIKELAISWLNDMRKQSPILAGIFVIIIIEKYGLEKILKMIGL